MDGIDIYVNRRDQIEIQTDAPRRIWKAVFAISPAAPQAQADARDAALAHLDGLLDDAAAHIYPSDLNKFQTGEHTATVASVRMGNSSERSVPLYSREQVAEAFDAAQAAQQGGAARKTPRYSRCRETPQQKPTCLNGRTAPQSPKPMAAICGNLTKALP